MCSSDNDPRNLRCYPKEYVFDNPSQCQGVNATIINASNMCVEPSCFNQFSCDTCTNAVGGGACCTFIV